MKNENDKIADTKNDVNTGNIAPETSSNELSDDKLNNVSGGYEIHGLETTYYPRFGNSKKGEEPGSGMTEEKCSVCGRYFAYVGIINTPGVMSRTKSPTEKICPECERAKK